MANEAGGYVKLIDNDWTISKIAERIGKSDRHVSDRVGLIRRLHPSVAEKVNWNGHLKPSHLEILAQIRSQEQQLRLSDLVERKRVSVRTLEQMVSVGQPLLEIIESRGESLYVPLPKEVATQLNVSLNALSGVAQQAMSFSVSFQELFSGLIEWNKDK